MNPCQEKVKDCNAHGIRGSLAPQVDARRTAPTSAGEMGRKMLNARLDSTLFPCSWWHLLGARVSCRLCILSLCILQLGVLSIGILKLGVTLSFVILGRAVDLNAIGDPEH